MTKTVVYLQKSDKKDKKFKVTIVNPNSKNKTIYFGASGYSDFTKHKDKERMKRYDSRHKPRENWTKSGIKTAGFWSKWILWSKPSLAEAKEYTSKKFNITIKSGKPPKNTVYKSRKKSHMSSINGENKTKTIRRKYSKRKSKVKRKSPTRKSKSKRRKSVKINKRPFNKRIWYVITKEGCKYCDNTKKLLKEKNIEADIEVINNDNKLIIYKEIDDITNNYRYFPVIFYNGKFIGGYTELQKHKF